MSQPVEFLNAFAHALAIMTLYPEGHPSREKSIETAFELLQSLTHTGTRPTFTFLDEEVVYGKICSGSSRRGSGVTDSSPPASSGSNSSGSSVTTSSRTFCRRFWRG